jgi:hypothetical protein
MQSTTASDRTTAGVQVEPATPQSITLPIIVGTIAGVVVAVIAVAIVVVACKRRSSHKERPKSSNELHLEVPKDLHVAVAKPNSRKAQEIQDIEIRQRLGGGKYGDVYLGMWQVFKLNPFWPILCQRKPLSLH